MSLTRRDALQIGATAAALLLPSGPVFSQEEKAPTFSIGGRADSTAPIRDEIVSRLKLQTTPEGQAELAEKKQKLVLLLPVGGTNGVVPGGMGSALLQYASWLQQKNPEGNTIPGSHIFNTIRAASAGAFTAPYFAAGQDYANSIYYHFLKGHEFYDIHRLYTWPKTHKPPMDIPYVFTVMTDYVPMHVNDALGPQSPKLEIQATSMPDRKPVTLANFGNQEALFDALRATSRQPLNSVKPYTLNGMHLIDGGFSDPLCLTDAFRDASDTRYVLFSNLPPNYKAKSISNEVHYFALNLFGNYPSSGKLLGALADAIREQKQMEKEGRLLVVSSPHYIQATDTRGSVLEAGAQEGMEAFCRTILGDKNVPAIERTVGRLPEGSYPGMVPLFKLKF